MSTLEKNIYKRVNVPANQQSAEIPESRKYKGISTVDPESSSFTLYDIALIKQDILNHFHIRQGEKLSDPTFGTIIWDVLFEPLTERLRTLILEDVTTIINYDPRVSVDSVVVDSYDNGIQIDVTLTYLSYNISEKMRLDFDRTNGLLV